MSIVLKIPTSESVPPASLPASATAALNHLRFASQECRASARAEFFETCNALRMRRDTRVEVYLMSFLSVLDQALGKRPVFHKPGATELSFDEAWLMSMILAAQRADADSMAFLLHRRVPHAKRRPFTELVHVLAGYLSK